MEYELGVRLDILERKLNYLIEKLVPEEVEVEKEKWVRMEILYLWVFY